MPTSSWVQATPWALVLATTLLGLSAPARADQAPDVLLVVVDTLRADYLTTYGFSAPTSPTVDGLAARGVVFNRAIAAASYTGPSHAAMLASVYPRQSSMGYANGALTLVGGKTLAEAYREAGWQTAAFVSNYVLKSGSGFERGFEHYDDSLGESERNRTDVKERTAGFTTRQALTWLGEAATARPVFLWVHYQDPHGPYTPPDAYVRRFQSLVDEAEPALPVLAGNDGLGGIPLYQELPCPARASDYRRRYAGEVAYFDRWLQELLAGVEQRRQGRPLIVLFTADHGEALGEHDRYFVHGHSVLPEVAHVPLVVVAPGLVPQRRPEVVSHVDVLPTLLDLSGVAVPASAHGLALGPWLRRRETIPARTVFCDIGHQIAAYRDRRLVRLRPPGVTPPMSVAMEAAFQLGRLKPNMLPSAQDLALVDGFAWDDRGLTETKPDPAMVRDLQSYLAATSVPAGAQTLVDADHEQSLRALGYLGQ